MGRKPLNRSVMEIRAQKNQTRRRHQCHMRRALAISDYLMLATPEMHRQAVQFVDQLTEKYPDKIDIRKTVEFRDWQRNRLTDVSNQSKTSEQADANAIVQKPKETQVVPNAEEDLINIFDQTSDNAIKDIVSEIYNDPEFASIMNDFNLEVLDQGTVPTEMKDDETDRHEYRHDDETDIEIEIDDRLEDELNKLM